MIFFEKGTFQILAGGKHPLCRLRIRKRRKGKEDMEKFWIGRIPLMDAEQLHQLADQWNWDDGLTVLRMIIDNPQCSLGTACLIYWRGSPHYFRKYTNRDEVEPFNREDYDLLQQIEKRMEANFFQHCGIRYEPRNDQGIDFTRCKYKASSLKRNIPAWMLVATTEQRTQPFELTKD